MVKALGDCTVCFCQKRQVLKENVECGSFLVQSTYASPNKHLRLSHYFPLQEPARAEANGQGMEKRKRAAVFHFQCGTPQAQGVVAPGCGTGSYAKYGASQRSTVWRSIPLRMW